MQTKIRTLDGLPIEEPVLDAEGQQKQRELSELVLREYEQTGKLSGPAVREKIEQYQNEIAGHVIE